MTSRGCFGHGAGGDRPRRRPSAIGEPGCPEDLLLLSRRRGSRVRGVPSKPKPFRRSCFVAQGRSGPFPLEQARGPGPLFRRPFIDAISRRLRGPAARAERRMRQVSKAPDCWRGNGQVPQQRRRPGRGIIRAATGATPAGADVTMRRGRRRSARRSSAAALRGAVAAAAPRGSLGHFSPWTNPRFRPAPPPEQPSRYVCGGWERERAGCDLNEECAAQASRPGGW
jgi:hypothetical protein